MQPQSPRTVDAEPKARLIRGACHGEESAKASNLAEPSRKKFNSLLLSRLSLRNKPFGHNAEGLSDCRDENGIARTDYSGHSPLLGSVGVGKCF